MSVELNLLFLEKKVEAARLCASLTEPFATGAEACDLKALLGDYDTVVKRLEESLKELKKLRDSIGGDGKTADVRLAQRAETAVGEVGRVALDFAAQIRFFEAMNPGDADKTKPMLGKFESLDKATREVTTKEGPEEGDEIMPEESGMPPGDEADPMLM